MVLFEIWSVGKKPLSQFTNNKAMNLEGAVKVQPTSSPRLPKSHLQTHGGLLVRSTLLSPLILIILRHDILRLYNNIYTSIPPSLIILLVAHHTQLYFPQAPCPVHSKHPKFSDICGYLKMSTDQLLKWNDRDEATQRAEELGAPLSKRESLY